MKSPWCKTPCQSTGSGLGEYTITRTFTVTDDAGNSTTDFQTITVIDTTAPEFTYVPADATYECSEFDAIAEALAENGTASDNCGAVEVAFVNVYTTTDAQGNYTVTRTFTATDDAGNSTSVEQVITVQDTTSPEFLYVPGDEIVECSNQELLDELYADEAIATDNCGDCGIEMVVDSTSAGRFWFGRLHHYPHVHCDGRRWQLHSGGLRPSL